LRKEGGSIQTSNHCLRSIKQLTRWLVLDRRHNDNVLTHLSTMSVETDLRRVRRPLTPAEFERLIASAEGGPTIWKPSGYHRATLYIIGAYTGFRKGEINSVTPSSFDFDSEPPTLTVQAGYSKGRDSPAFGLRQTDQGVVGQQGAA
jgi:integrase